MRGGEILHESLLGLSEKGGPQHTTALLAELERAAAAAGGWEEVDAVAVGLGPGSFTGLRVGVATARAVGLSRGLRVRGVCTLDALARGEEGRAPGRQRLAVLDARRGEVFAALCAPGGERLWDPLVASPEELAERVAELPEPPLGAGPGAIRSRQALASRGVEIPDDADPVHRVAARHICALAVTGSGGDDTGPVAPLYLRRPDAERWRERDTVRKAD